MEKRKQVRVVPFPKQPVQLQLMGNGFLDILIAQDVSEGGIAVRVPHKFDGCDIHSSVEIVVSLPGYKPFKALGKIKHLSASKEAQGLFGLQFTQIDVKGKGFLLDYVKKLTSLRRMAG
ncbi:pilus assembly protein PilZ [Leptospira hartskeerlii]|uniref:Pilus assembly protein PilZ n=1 Tax=Leptospira hartskeerlii TaxID=2023177 RepID=A0A2M9XIG9_9LEPT|nr:PilZ domain-containing protein [Leptospira hartskeerlii]PJZ27488.1 pilus assembly protein PilZ [Leptospira hartskeerlii]PJZ32345.1 pilus assembly protein PilZ [Leptospira hartskeerlii]